MSESQTTGDSAPSRVAYFSMEVGLEPDIPTYSGGLGVLAGDTLRGAADLGLPMVGVTLLYRHGYFRQELESDGRQVTQPVEWRPEDRLDELEPRVEVTIEGRSVVVRAWRYTVTGRSGGEVPVLLLDTDLDGNPPEYRRLTHRLYGGDRRYRLHQEVVLGVGGIAMLAALGYDERVVHHMNEGHSALLGLALLERALPDGDLRGADEAAVDAVRERCVFTTHTPVPAGHDRFPTPLVAEVLGERRTDALDRIGALADGELNMTLLALELSRYVNGVALRHRHVSRGMFPGYPIGSITNGVHADTWVAPPFERLFDRHMSEWHADSFTLRYAVGIPTAEIRAAHEEAKRDLLAEVEARTGRALDPDVLTLGFARRATQYKRADLLFSDLDRLRRIARDAGGLQVLYAGKAHPQDEAGQAMIRRVFEAAEALDGDVPVVYLADYGMALARMMCAGVDVWLNTPCKPQEASGTSGMKAALNGVPSLSVLDGWWVEGHVEDVTGWSIGEPWPAESDSEKEAASLYDQLEQAVLPMYYRSPDRFAQMMRSAIALNGSFFTAQRMVYQYATNAYGLAVHPRRVEAIAQANGR